MKTMTCRQLGGACDKQFRASSFAEIAEMSKQHGMEMFQDQGRCSYQGDERNETADAKTRRDGGLVRK